MSWTQHTKLFIIRVKPHSHLSEDFVVSPEGSTSNYILGRCWLPVMCRLGGMYFMLAYGVCEMASIDLGLPSNLESYLESVRSGIYFERPRSFKVCPTEASLGVKSCESSSRVGQKFTRLVSCKEPH